MDRTDPAWSRRRLGVVVLAGEHVGLGLVPDRGIDDVSAALRFAADAVADREIPLQPTA